MKHRCINGWTPHSVFDAVINSNTTEQVPVLFYRLNQYGLDYRQPFSERTYRKILNFCENKNTHEAFARWLVANTEGDW